MILLTKAMYFWENRTKSEISFSCYIVSYLKHILILNVDFKNRHKLLSTVVHWVFHIEAIHMLIFCEILASVYLQCSQSEILKVSFVCMMRRNDLLAIFDIQKMSLDLESIYQV